MQREKQTPKRDSVPTWLSTENSLAGQLFTESLKFKAPAVIVKALRQQEVPIVITDKYAGSRPTYYDVFHALHLHDAIKVNVQVQKMQDGHGKRMLSVLINGTVNKKYFFVYSGYNQVHLRAGNNMRGLLSTTLDIYATKRKKAIGLNP